MPINQPAYRIRLVDTEDEDVVDALVDLHRATFLDAAQLPPFQQGAWWLVYHGDTAVAFAGLVPSTHAPSSGYFSRVGVVERHWGRGLQLRLMRAAEARARRVGWTSIVSDTTDNVVSANNFIRAGYRLYCPKAPWSWPNSLYWKKRLG